MESFRWKSFFLLLSLVVQSIMLSSMAFSTSELVSKRWTHQSTLLSMSATSTEAIDESEIRCLSRRSLLFKGIAATASISAALITSTTTHITPAQAASADSLDLDSYLYKIVRVREATQQERRLIQTGKFKDIQRANVKLAVKFMVQNYRLADCVVGASAYLKGGNTAQMKAIDVGQTAVQNLQTILEYFDTSDVENIKVSSSGLGGKEELVLKGLEAAQLKLDEFLGFFDDSTVAKIKAKVQEENELNVKEFDRSLGDIINLPPPS